MFECLHRFATLRRLAIEELDDRRDKLAKLRAIRAPREIIANEKRLVKRAGKLCSILEVK